METTIVYKDNETPMMQFSVEIDENLLKEAKSGDKIEITITRVVIQSNEER